MRTVADLDPAVTGSTPPQVVLSYGLGVDSTAILLRWLTDPTSRDFDLADLALVTSMTGDEWLQTGTDVTTHVLPLLRRHRVRYVQAARAQRYVTANGDGIAVLDDSRVPTRLFLDGVYRLSDEMRQSGTLPQRSGARLCSVHAKGDVLDPVIARLTDGHSYRHAIGFETGEQRRADKDQRYDTGTRTGIYPLIEWGWDRAACEAYITAVTGATWMKSSCTYCVFSLATNAGRERTLRRYADHPDAGVDTLMLEHLALALNPAQGLIGSQRAYDAVRAAGHLAVLEAFHARLNATEHAVYEVRRILRPRKDDPTKLANASRSLRRWAHGARSDMLSVLAAAGVVEVADDGIARVYLRRRGERLPTSEHFLVVAPAGALEKESAKFSDWWAALHPEPAADALVSP